MSAFAGLLGILASLCMAGASCCHLMPPAPTSAHHGGHGGRHGGHGGGHRPQDMPDGPSGCHASLTCAAHRRLTKDGARA